jgi:hypothetical protein
MRDGPILWIALAALGVAAAGCGAPQSNTNPTTDSGACKHSAQNPAPPTVDQLTNMLKITEDQSRPLSERVQYLQGGEGDPELPNRVAAALQNARYSAKIHSVTDSCNGTAYADVTATFNDQTNEVEIPIVAENGRWKLNKEWACGWLSNAEISSPICTK